MTDAQIHAMIARGALAAADRNDALAEECEPLSEAYFYYRNAAAADRDTAALHMEKSA